MDKFKTMLISFFNYLWALIQVGLFFWGLGIFMGGALFFENVLVGYLFGALLIACSTSLSALTARLSREKKATKAQSITDKKIKTRGVADMPKYIQELELQQERRRKIDAYERAHRRADKGSRRLRQIGAHIYEEKY